MANAVSFAGRYRFPGTFAFFDTPGIPRPALLQFDPTQTGVFDDLAAQNTSGDLQTRFQDGDPGSVTGVLLNSDVNGVTRPVLFFTSAVLAPLPVPAT
jgi:hypothetical protein